MAAKLMSWEEIAREFLQSIIHDHGGLVAAVVVFALISIATLVLGLSGAVYVIKKMKIELDRMAAEKKKLEKEVLKRRLSSSAKTKKGK